MAYRVATPRSRVCPCGLRARPVQIGRPVVHQPAAAREQIRARVGRLRRVAHRMGERGFDHLTRRRRVLRRPVPEARPEPMRPSVAPGLRPWSRFAKVSANASAPSATGSPAGCVFATTTARTTWLTISNRRSRSSGLRVPRASCESPKARGSRSVSSARYRRISCGCGASTRSRNSASPCSSFNRRTTSSGCWRSTPIGVQPKCDAISTGWTR